MHGLRHSRRLGCLLAGWLLAWFMAMAAAPLAPWAGQGVPMASAAADHSHEHGASHAHERHEGHGAGAVVHCPMCVHAAAPPRAAPAQPAVADLPALQAVALVFAVLRVRSAAPPPGRGPPAFS